ncbi:MAG TPA: hypothetical protein VKA46_26045 [Gemmataceae bacterium]|nr:hypothetical protein [Gemmataceae bacterium]
MAGAAVRGALAGAVVMLGGMTSAGEPLPPPMMDMRGPIGFVRPDPYAVWQDYGVDRRGRFRPLVAPSYDGLRYVGTGEPYPWWQNHPGWITPMVANPAAFGGPAPPALMMMGPPPVILPPPAADWARMPYAEK